MSKPAVGSYFTGGGIGLAGLKGKVDFAFAVEYDAEIAESYRANISDRVIVSRVQDVDVRKLEPVEYFQTSNECKEFSTAKTGGREGPEQISQAEAVCRYLDYHKPPLFLLENVRGYVKSKAFQMIVVKLSLLGYTQRVTVENAANYGVPQTRERLILRAALDRPLPSLPDHVDGWTGWYQAIEDLIPTLPESHFAQWQLDRLPAEMENILLDGKKSGQEWGKRYRTGDEPAFTSTIDSREKAFIFNSTFGNIRYSEEPMTTLTASFHSKTTVPQAFLMNGGNASNERCHRFADEPSVTVSASSGNVAARAFLMSDQTSNSGQDVGLRAESEPSMVVDTRPASKVRAFIVDGQTSDNGRLLTIRNGQEPVYTIQSSADHKPARAWLSLGRVVKMTPRALARFQSIQDWYVLPDKNALACKIIGNGWPTEMGRKISEKMLGIETQN